MQNTQRIFDNAGLTVWAHFTDGCRPYYQVEYITPKGKKHHIDCPILNRHAFVIYDRPEALPVKVRSKIKQVIAAHMREVYPNYL